MSVAVLSISASTGMQIKLINILNLLIRDTTYISQWAFLQEG